SAWLLTLYLPPRDGHLSGIRFFTALLRAQDPRDRQYAARNLGELRVGDGLTVGALTDALEDDDLEVRRAAAWALTQIQGAEARAALPIVVQALADPDAHARSAANQALTVIGLPGLMEALADPDANVRLAAIQALAALGPRARGAVRALTQVLRDTEDGARYEAARALIRIQGVEARAVIPVLIEGLKGEDAQVRVSSALLLAELGPAAAEAAQALADAIGDG